MKKIETKKGFTLPEVLISLSILSMVVLAATDLVVSNLRINVDNMNTIIAYGLAQEGIEAMREIRDSNWLLGANYGKSGKIAGSEIWGTPLPGQGQAVDYALDYGVFENNVRGFGAGKIDSSNAPWQLQALSGSEDELFTSAKTVLYKGKSLASNDTVYQITPENNFKETPFHRLIKIENISHQIAGRESPILGKKYRVTSTIAWIEGTLKRKISLSTELTDWKEGAI